ncbi:gamma-butyrobetaine dioxygenase-like [Anneissia japonica]|uniref:gamma-butyrobetaine dioxygenase-like n=1 Tax=Anneissia japonica TaxID=1529436 RepID=UPI0014259AD2|nr:gamma-butyrobetaine dioxygenase-like [Anneissia japonica]XP_033098453.1 gamma-butyrobetaine dioxygenase-like [Anneissia japonica]XP_033098454.1 gamma-butyrobetaine dioxygenase-like [Anneissia japonica]
MTALSRFVLGGVNVNTRCCQRLLNAFLNKTPLQSVCCYKKIHHSSNKLTSSKYPHNMSSSIWTSSTSSGKIQIKEDIGRCSAAASDDGDFLHILWDDGSMTRYPYLWIRDNCGCSQCFNKDMNQRLFSYKTFNADVKLVDVQNESPGAIALRGTDDHITTLNFAWLRDKGAELLEGKPDIHLTKVHWGADIISILPVFQYDEVISDYATMYEWMKSIKIFGIGRINGAPKESGELMNIAKRIAHVRKTLFGDISIIKARSDAFFIGYTPIELPLHTDYTFGKTVPGVLLLHSIERPQSGGENWFADGFKAAHDLREIDENAFNLLCRGILEYEIDGTSQEKDVHLKGQFPTISLNSTGEVEMVSYSDHTRTASIKNISTEGIPAFYRALKTFAGLLYSPKNLMVLPLEEGDMLATDNFRILHGRAGFTLGKNTGRHVEHIFFDIEDFDSRMRCIANKMT